MAQAGRCYEDNPADYAKYIGLYEMKCMGFNYNFDDCQEKCPFNLDSHDASVYDQQKYTVFGDSKCQYRIKDDKAKVKNVYIQKETEDLLIYHSYE